MSRTGPLTKEKKQELISRRQFAECLEQYGWTTAVPEDLGEDFIVNVYIDGFPTGVNFYVQLKSVTNLQKRQKGEWLVYKGVKTKHLLNWEEFGQPLILVVWDICLGEGRWEAIDKVIDKLDRDRPRWRSNKPDTKTVVHLPWENTTDDPGLAKLKRTIGQWMYSLISRGKPLKGKVYFEFPNTEAGQAAKADYLDVVYEGGEREISGDFVTFRLPDWHAKWFGQPQTWGETLIIGRKYPDKVHTLDIDIMSSDGEVASAPGIEFKIVGGGDRVTRHSNKHQSTPLHFQTEIRLESEIVRAFTFSVAVNYLGASVSAALESLRFVRAFETGGTMRVSSPGSSQEPWSVPVPAQVKRVTDTGYCDLLEKLSRIQQATRQLIRLPADGELTHRDARRIDYVAAAVDRGRISWKTGEILLDVSPEMVREIIKSRYIPGVGRLRFIDSIEDQVVDVCGTPVDVGTVRKCVAGTIVESAVELGKAAESIPANQTVTLRVVDVEITDIFWDWYLREARRLSDHITRNIGARKVILFGWLVWHDVFPTESAIQLAVRASDDEQFARIVEYSKTTSKYRVEIEDVRKMPEDLLGRVLEDGVVQSSGMTGEDS